MKKYPAKLLLFGEHTVNLGSQALAMPLPLFSGHWAFSKNKIEGKEIPYYSREKWVKRLFELADYLTTAPLFIKLDINRFRKELSNGLYFESDIPTGYGAGSSGALVAAIFDRYCMVREGKDLTLLKKTLAQMEGFFHGTSSGTDPLICYLNVPIILNKKDIKKVELPKIKLPYTLFLLDTKIERQATPFIEYFLDKTKEDSFREKLNNNYLPAVEAAIHSFKTGNWNLSFNQFKLISEFQFIFLKKMIPADFLGVWEKGFASDYFKLKICGAGGGGFILGMTKDFNRLKNDFNRFDFLEIKI